MIADVERFCKERGLAEHMALFSRAALVARNPHQFAQIQELTPEEQDALEFERANKYKGSFWLWYSVIMCAVGAAQVFPSPLV